jgi:hypothetical protein
MPNDMEEFIKVVAHPRLRLILLAIRDTVDILQHFVRIDLELAHLAPDNIAELHVLEQELSVCQVREEDDDRAHPLELAFLCTSFLHVAAYKGKVSLQNGRKHALLLGARPIGMVGSRDGSPGIDVLLAEGGGDGSGGHGWLPSSARDGFNFFCDNAPKKKGPTPASLISSYFWILWDFWALFSKRLQAASRSA